MRNNFWNIFSKIRNGQMIKYSNIKHKNIQNCENFLKILWDEGFISGYRINPGNKKNCEIFLKYKNNRPVINSIKLITKPGHKIYYSSKQIWKINSSNKLVIISTNMGLKSLTDCKKLKIGGEAFLVVT